MTTPLPVDPDLEKFKPVVYLDKDEQYMPCSIEYIFQNSELVVNGVSVGTVSPNTVPLNIPSGSYLNINPNSWGGQGVNSPFYGSTYPLPNGEKMLQYSFIYTYNGAYYLFGCKSCALGCSCCSCFIQGEHQGDVEHCSIHLDNKGKIKQIYFGAHQRGNGMWKNPSEISWEDGHPVMFSAKGSHGVYPSSGCFPRIFCSVNDWTNNGKRWFPPVIQISSSTHWMQFLGCLGSSDTPLHQSWWQNETVTSTNFFKRLCCPFSYFNSPTN